MAAYTSLVSDVNSSLLSNPTIINRDSSQWSTVYQPHDQSVLYYCLIYFVIGLIVSPWSAGIVWLILFIVVHEIFVALYRRHDLLNYNSGYYLFDRVAMGAATILGFIVGRTIIGDDNPMLAADEFALANFLPWIGTSEETDSRLEQNNRP